MPRFAKYVQSYKESKHIFLITKLKTNYNMMSSSVTAYVYQQVNGCVIQTLLLWKNILHKILLQLELKLLN